MLKDEIKKIILKKDQKQPKLSFETHDHGYKVETGCKKKKKKKKNVKG